MCQRALEEKASLQSATVCARGRGVYVMGRRAGRPSSWEPWDTWRTLFWSRCDVDESCSLIVIDFGLARSSWLFWLTTGHQMIGRIEYTYM
jgi:hypothetical protein